MVKTFPLVPFTSWVYTESTLFSLNCVMSLSLIIIHTSHVDAKLLEISTNKNCNLKSDFVWSNCFIVICISLYIDVCIIITIKQAENVIGPHLQI